jgi:hypothetical protein
MRQPQVCKHQVCDHCGGRFGMVTHRWWGNKFCKRTCKDAYLHEVSLDQDMIRRWVSLSSRRHWRPLMVGEKRGLRGNEGNKVKSDLEAASE